MKNLSLAAVQATIAPMLVQIVPIATLTGIFAESIGEGLTEAYGINYVLSVLGVIGLEATGGSICNSAVRSYQNGSHWAAKTLLTVFVLIYLAVVMVVTYYLHVSHGWLYALLFLLLPLSYASYQIVHGYLKIEKEQTEAIQHDWEIEQAKLEADREKRDLQRMRLENKRIELENGASLPVLPAQINPKPISDENRPEWLTFVPQSLEAFLDGIRNQQLNPPKDLKAKELARWVPVSERSCLTWIKRWKAMENESG